MQTLEWRFRLEGKELDLRAVADAFKRELRLSEDEDKKLWLALSLPYGRGEGRAAYEDARDWLSRINGILQVIHGDHESVTVGAIESKSESGQWNGYLIVKKGLRMRLRRGTSAVFVSRGQKVAAPQEGRGDRLRQAASKNDAFDRAVYLYGCVPRNWRGLYMVLEAAEDWCGGQKMLETKGWVDPPARITDFKSTANSFRAIGREARHGSTAKGIPAPRMTRDEAEELVREILNRWAQELS